MLRHFPARKGGTASRNFPASYSNVNHAEFGCENAISLDTMTVEVSADEVPVEQLPAIRRGGATVVVTFVLVRAC
jgi:hypothetical protein